MLKGKAPWRPSLLFLYYNTRAIEGAVHIDRGAQIRNALKASAEFGLCDERFMPFEPERFSVQPRPNAYGEATQHQALVYERCRLEHIRSCLADTIPVVFGATIFENFEHNGPNIQMPVGSIVGGHAMLAVGYTSSVFIVRNSWGEAWGDHGYCYVPYDYMLNENLVSDTWAIYDTEL